MSNNKQVRSIVIVGGGTSGWMTAAALSNQFKQRNIAITLIESTQMGTIGVGEATIPTLRRFYAKLGLSDIEVMKATNATCKLGIEFKDWFKKGSSFIHPFGLFGQGTEKVPFHHYWMKLQQQGETTNLEEYSLGVMLARHNKFNPPPEKPSSYLAIFDWALHFDAALFAKLMHEKASANGVTHIDDKITEVKLNQQGEIQNLILQSGQSVDGDLFIDCSGFSSLLLGKALNTDYIDWSEWLLCDKAVAVQSESIGEPVPRTISTAHEAGWQWTIPLQHRQGNGHVYSSQFINDDEATETLLNNIEGQPLHQPRNFSFTPGRRDKSWVKNCVAIGLSSGFLEPLESTSIALVETAIDRLLMTFEKVDHYGQVMVDRFNEVTALEYERVRDFIILHYKATHRDDSEMWRYCQQMSVPDSLNEKMEAFRIKGDIPRLPWEIFGLDSWLAIYNGFNYLPETYHPDVDKMKPDYLRNSLAQMRASVINSVNAVPTHSEFLSHYFNFQANQKTPS